MKSILVTRENDQELIAELCQFEELGFDTETTGLMWKDQAFSFIFSTGDTSYYFNFKDYGYIIDDVHCLSSPKILQPIFDGRTFYSHNAKFDMNMARKAGLDIGSSLFVCSLAMERIIKNNLLPSQFGLDAIVKRKLNEEKEGAVEDYITKNKLFTTIEIPGKKKTEKIPHYDRVPLEIIAPYGCKDASLHYYLGKANKEILSAMGDKYKTPIKKIVENEIRLTYTCQKMEEVGIKIDVEYTRSALEYEAKLIKENQENFKRLTGLPYQDSRTTFVKAFDRLGLNYPTTEKGNPSFAGDVLEAIDNPVASIINTIRHHEKRVGTYYSSFLYYKDEQDVVHANIKQAGTETGRMSYSNPNLQNVPKEDEEEDLLKPYLVRSCFVPRDGYCFVMIDYQQQEFRMLLDYADERKMIALVNDGADVHQATADQVGITRKQAKTLNFALLYGMGVGKLGARLGIDEKEARALKDQYFSKLRNVSRFMREVQRTAVNRGYIRNKYGRICHLFSSEYDYIMLNHLIQGSCADTAKIAMNRCSDFLHNKKSRLLVQVHDELLFEIHETELDIVPQLSIIMDQVYEPMNGLRLTTSTEHSWKSWGHRDKVKGEPPWQSNLGSMLEKINMETSSNSRPQTPIH